MRANLVLHSVTFAFNNTRSYRMQIERCPSEVDATQNWQRIIDFFCGSAVAQVWFEIKSDSAHEDTANSEAYDLQIEG